MAKKSYTDGKLLIGNCLDTLKTLPDNSIDSVVTDPPYELGFMGKSWDNTGIAFNVAVWQECMRVLKPGGHLLAFSGSRTYHRMAVAIEDAGFEIRDQIMWIYGSGFPKSMAIDKAIDKAAGAKRKVVGTKIKKAGDITNGSFKRDGAYPDKEIDITTPSTKEAKQWQGWGTALKPAHEPIVVARKPISMKTVAENVLTYGTGAINIDASRVGTETITINGQGNEKMFHGNFSGQIDNPERIGRFPANVIHDGSDEVVELFPDTGKSTGGRIGKKSMGDVTNVPAGEYEAGDPGYGDTGTAARFFYCAKASKSERNAGLDGIEGKSIGAKGNGLARTCATCSASVLDGCQCVDRTFVNPTKKNFHPTVKPLTLMRYLIKLVTPPNGTVLDPFLGSGTTAVAAVLEDFEWKGCEMTDDYLPIIKGRLDWAVKEKKKEQPKLL